MANRKISSLSALGATPAVGDIIPITDVSDTTGSAQGTTKKVTVANLVAAAPQGDLLALIIYLMLRMPERVGRI